MISTREPAESCRLIADSHRTVRRWTVGTACALSLPAAAVLLLCGGAPRAAEDAAAAATLGPGFTAAGSAAERTAEAPFLPPPQPQKIRGYLAALTEEPHVAGTPGGEAAARWVLDRLRDWDLDATIVSYDVLLNLPAKVSLKMTVPEERELSLRETGYPRD